MPSLPRLLLAFLVVCSPALARTHVFPNAKIPKVMMHPHFLRPKLKTRPRAGSAFTGYTPAQIRHAYGIDQLPSQGAGATIAIVDATNHFGLLNVINQFSQAYGLPTFSSINGPGFRVVSQTSGDVATYADIPSAVFSPGINPNVLDDPFGWSQEIELDIEWAHAVAPQANILLVLVNDATLSNLAAGIYYAATHADVVSMSFGGTEYSDETVMDDVLFCNFPGVTFTASAGDTGAIPGYPSVSPCVLSVGGTNLRLDANNNVVSETAWVSANPANGATGGGISQYEVLRPSQSLYVTQGAGSRRTPDVSYDADPNTGVAVYSYYIGPSPTAVGGTSAGAPQWAALIALAISSGNQPQIRRPFDPLLGLYAMNAAPGAFYDVASDTGGYPNYGYSAAPGYDELTGLGSPRAQFVPAYIRTASGAYSLLQFYQDLLGRSAALSELYAWMRGLGSGASTTQVANSIQYLSQEGGDRLVKSWYQIYLGRSAGNGEEQGFVNLLLGGASLEGSLNPLLSSWEYQNRANQRFNAGNARGNFLYALYNDLLYRNPDPGGYQYFSNPAFSPSQIVSAILSSGEYRSDLISLFYSNPQGRPSAVRTSILNRSSAPASSEVSGWANSGFLLGPIEAYFYGSQEYANRAMGMVLRYSDVYLSNLTGNSVTVNWSTTEAASSYINYGTTIAYGNTTPAEATVSTTHSMTLSGLTPGQTLHFQIVSTSNSGQTIKSPDWSLSVPDSPPVISNVQVTHQYFSCDLLGNVIGYATFSWSTDKPSTSVVNLGLTNAYGTYCEDESGAGFVPGSFITQHQGSCMWRIPQLQCNWTGVPSSTAPLTYHFRVESADPSGAIGGSPDSTFSIQ